jgi:hypothetical protein
MATKSKRSNSRSSRSTSQTTTDHEEIRQWAESRGGHPACVRGTGGRGDTGMLRIDFPGYSGGDSLQEISWDEFFEKFEDQNLALLHQDTTSGGEESRFNKLVRRTGNADGRGNRGGAGGSNRGRSGSSSRSAGSSGRTTASSGRSASSSRRSAGSSGRSAAGSRSEGGRSPKSGSSKSGGSARGRTGERGGKELEMECVMIPVSRSGGRAMKGKSGGSRGGKSSGAAGSTRAAARGGRASAKSRSSGR